MKSTDSRIARVIFFQVKETKEKLLRIAETAAIHFEKKEAMIFFVEDEKAEQYLDELLWKIPANSFLPHSIATTSTEELIIVTRSKQNLNQARYAFNLCSTPLLIDSPFRMVYEFEDLTSPSKQHLSSLRFDAYKKALWAIEAR